MSSILQITLLEVYTPGDAQCWDVQVLSLLNDNELLWGPPCLGQAKTQNPFSTINS